MIKILAVLLALVLIVPTIGVVGVKTVVNLTEGKPFGEAIAIAWSDWTGTITNLLGGAEASAGT